LTAAQSLERQFASAIQKRVIDPWRRQVRQWLEGLVAQELPVSPDMFRQLLEREVPVDRALYYAVIDEFRLKTANLAGQAALDKIVATTRRFVRTGEAEARVEEVGKRTLAERLQAGEEWNAVATGGTIFNLRDPALLRELKQRGAGITGDPTTTMMDELHSVLERKMYREGQGPAVVAADLDGVFPPTYAGRAENIARTEMRIAQGIVTHATYEKNGVDQRQWFALLDGNTREEHAAAHGQVRGMDKPFEVGGEAMMHPGDPSASVENIARCRCDELPVIDGESSLPAQPWVGGYQPLTAEARANAAPIA